MEMTALQPRRLPHAPRVVGFHRAQELGSSASRVHAVSWGTDPLLDVVSSRDPAQVPDWLGCWGAVLDAAYGYQLSPDHPRGIARRSPSAGALYPIEVFAIGQGQAYQYSFWNRRFHSAPGCDATAAAGALELAPDGLALVLVAVFWRTVQRYGVRGYRYCMVDAGNVQANLISVIEAGGVADLSIASPSARLSRTLALPVSVGVVSALTVRCPSQLLPQRCLVPGWSRPPRQGADEQCPLLSPALHRVVRFHLEALGDSAPLPVQKGAISDRALALRLSAKSFTPEPLPQSVLCAIRERLAARRPQLRVAEGALRCFLVRVRVQGQEPGIERIDAPGAHAEVELGGVAAASLALRVRAVCQDQVLAGEAALAVLIGVRGAVVHAASAAAYRDLLSEVGHLGAELGAQAAELQIGTTTIGGFYDAAARHLTRDDAWYPIAIQLYGHAGRRGRKLDAASRVLENLNNRE